MAHGTVITVAWESVTSSEYDLFVKDGAGSVIARARYSNRIPSDLERERNLITDAISSFYGELIEWRD